MNILMCASESTPFAKTGGLADVVGTLTHDLAARGHDVRLVLPLYAAVNQTKFPMTTAVPHLSVPLGFGEKGCAVREAKMPDSDARIYFIEHNDYFRRSGLYGQDGYDYGDNAERFAFFSRACLQLAKALNFKPDVVHVHDWQTAIIPAMLAAHERGHPLLGSAATVISIHNLGYQGSFSKFDLLHSQLGWEYFTHRGFEFYDQLNYLKGGIQFADKIVAVSPTYAREIQTPEHGWGLDGVMRDRAGDLIGILNGCDYYEWDPSRDRQLPAKFDVGDMAGKKICKAELQRQFNLPVRPDVPVVSILSRLAYQKGIDVIAASLPEMMEMDMQLVTLGTGETWANLFYGELPARYPGKAGSFIGFDEAKAHLVYAGSDFLLMPSRYEPCGLTQTIAMRYGTLPIVRETGGLVDTVQSYDEHYQSGTGFMHRDLTPSAVSNTVGWAVSTYYDRPQHMLGLVDRAMKARFSWQDSIAKYENVYRWAQQRRHSV